MMVPTATQDTGRPWKACGGNHCARVIPGLRLPALALLVHGAVEARLIGCGAAHRCPAPPGSTCALLLSSCLPAVHIIVASAPDTRAPGPCLAHRLGFARRLAYHGCNTVCR